jgi:nucleotidyltransferase substrate binding protein (TIGR01987 family)
MKKENNKLEKLRLAVNRLEEVLKRDTTDLVIADSVIQRFEFSYELCWKALKDILATEGFVINSPKSAFQKAFAEEWINDEQLWIDMIEDRNLTTHTYDEDIAIKVVKNVTEKHFPEMKRLLIILEEKTTNA